MQPFSIIAICMIDHIILLNYPVFIKENSPEYYKTKKKLLIKLLYNEEQTCFSYCVIVCI